MTVRLARARRVHVWIAASLAFAAGCSSGPTDVDDTPMEVVIASGDGQYGTVGQTLAAPLQVLVRSVSTGLARRGVQVDWDIVSGDAEFVGVSTTTTDSTGTARISVRLGTSIGEVVVRAAALGADTSVEFQLFTVDRPMITSLEPTSAPPGTSVTITGSNFSPVAAQNVVLFSGVRGLVTAASPGELRVTVPWCLPPRTVAVGVQLGNVASDPLPLAVSTGGDVLALSVGDTYDATDDEALSCITVPGDARYLVAVHSASDVGAAAYPFSLTGLSGAVSPPAAVAYDGPLRVSDAPSGEEQWLTFRGAGGSAGPDDPQALWDGYLREVEGRLTGQVGASAGSGGSSSNGPRLSVQPAPVGPARVPPQVGDRRTFQVFQSTGNYEEVNAVARFVGDRAALFVDERAPGGGYTSADLAYFSDHFDELIHPTVTGAFGDQSDLDENERIVILFTPAVNALTPRGAAGFIGGFFFGLDLLPERDNSNGGEIFYAIVPDPTGIYSDPRPKEPLKELTPAVLAHEFQHMVNFNERVLERGAEANESVWLSEALAQWAEELVARVAEDTGESADVTEMYRDGARIRARRYLSEPDTVSLIISAGSGNLPERGAGFLYMMYLVHQFGDDLARRLTQTTRTGVANVEAETGTEWGQLLSDWWTALYWDGLGPPTGPLVYPDLDLRTYLEDPFPLEPIPLGGADFNRTGSLRSSSVVYYIVNPGAGATATIRLGGEAGGVHAPQARMRMRVIRIE